MIDGRIYNGLESQSDRIHPMMNFVLRSVGNPDFGQDPDRPLPGVPVIKKQVSTLANASKACRDYIGKYGLGGGNWPETKIFEGTKEIGRISYNGIVWAPGNWTSESEQLWPPATPATEDEFDPFKGESAIIDVPGVCSVEVYGTFDHSGLKSVKGSFHLEGRTLLLHDYFIHRRDGAQGFIPRRELCLIDTLTGEHFKSAGTKRAAEAISAAVCQWFATPEGYAMIARNQRKSILQQVAVSRRNIGYLQKQIADLEGDIATGEKAASDVSEDLPEQVGISP
jgi:hypothetical protein